MDATAAAVVTIDREVMPNAPAGPRSRGTYNARVKPICRPAILLAAVVVVAVLLPSVGDAHAGYMQ
jgi:hypothetical protein